MDGWFLCKHSKKVMAVRLRQTAQEDRFRSILNFCKQVARQAFLTHLDQLGNNACEVLG